MTDEFTLQCTIEFYDIVRLIKSIGQENDVAQTVAMYLTSYIDYELDLSQYIWNTLLFNVHIFESEEDVIEFIKFEGLEEGYTKYKCSNGLWYVEVY